MTFAPPVSRDNFHYNGSLFVDVGNLNRHGRATVDEITSILRPDVKKPKKASLDPPKDQVGHWYEAQLIHYGLPPSKDKARAKMRLLEALNQSTLVVPPNIAKMEADMKKEYAAAERKAKAQYKASIAPTAKSEPATAGKKRKQSEPSGNINNFNVNISFGNNMQGFSSTVNASDSQSPAKKAKTGPSKPTNKKSEAVASSKKPSGPAIKQTSSQAPKAPNRPKQTARAPQLTAAWLKDPSIGPGPIDPSTGLHIPHPSSTKKGAAKEKPPARKEATVKTPSATKPKPKVKAETHVKKEPSLGKTPQIKKEAKVKSETPTTPSPRIKKEPPAAETLPPLGLLNGLYDLSCPTVEHEFPYSLEPTLTLALQGDTLWGAYDLGHFTGILFLPSRPYAASVDPIPFTWRGRENGMGEMSFGPGCEGEIAFLGQGRVRGWIGVYGRCEFEGVRRGEMGTAVRAAGHMRAEWEGYGEEGYEEERGGRW